MYRASWLRTAFLISFCCGFLFAECAWAKDIDLSRAAIVTRPGDLPNAEKTAAKALAEEVQKRTGIVMRSLWAQLWSLGAC